MSGTTLNAGTLLANGLTITSSSTPALNGTYACVGVALEGIQSEAMVIALDNTAADGSGTIDWPDKHNVGHSFTVAQFKTFAVAMANFQVQCMQYAAGIIATAPSSNATIP